MKTREEILKEVLELPNKHIALSISTGVGKSRLALEKLKSVSKETNDVLFILVVVPVNNLKDTWLNEIKKWQADGTQRWYTFTTYKSLHKYTEGTYDMVIFDEAHHITPRVMDIIKVMKFQRSMLLSATLKPLLIAKLRLYMKDLKVYRVNTQEAIESNILPDPRILLMPLKFNCKDLTETIVKNPKAKKTIVIPYAKRHCYKDKTAKYEIPCTELQYNMDLDTQVEWYKKKAMGGNVALKNLWLHKAGERLKWLATKKTPYVISLLRLLQKERTITFCASIDQAEKIDPINRIHSKNSESLETLDRFNTNQIDHITSIAMLDEGVNLVNCRISIFANINSSERLQIQRIGRSLRHSSPIIILMYFTNSREEEIVDKMIEGYNPELITKINDIKDITKWI